MKRIYSSLKTNSLKLQKQKIIEDTNNSIAQQINAICNNILKDNNYIKYKGNSYL